MNNLQHPNTPSPQKEKQTSGIKTFLQKKYIASALAIALLTGGGYLTHYVIKDKYKNQKEIILNTDGYPFEKHKLPYRDEDTTFFTNHFQPTKETLAPGIHIIRDAGLIFYIVQADDFITKTEITYTYEKKGKKTIKTPHTIKKKEVDFDKIRNKLGNLPEFSYLKEPHYDRINPNNKTKSFNIPKESVKPGMYIPIPLDNDIREISPQDFANYCYEAIQEMKHTTPTYRKEMQELLSYATEKDLIIAMIAFARSETSAEYTSFIQPIGNVELHRWEPKYRAFSFSYFHILMEKNSDGTEGPGLKARLKLGLTEGQCYHPKNAAKLFLAYRIEKTNGNLKGIFPLTKNNLKKVSKKYNGSASYAKKLGPNLEFATKLMNGEIVYYDDIQLKNSGFIYVGLNSKYQHVYKFTTPPGISTLPQLKKFIIKTFNTNRPINCPKITGNDIVTKTNQPLSGSIVPDVVYIIVPTQ